MPTGKFARTDAHKQHLRRAAQIRNGTYGLTPTERFYKWVHKTDTCWLWLGATGINGHGQFWFPKIAQGGRLTSAHRASYYLAHGPIPDGFDVCHKCDNPPCVNPSHLFLGTAKDNMRDAIQKGRFKFPKPRLGESNVNAKLTYEQVASARAMRANGASIIGLSRIYGVARATIRAAVNGDTWR